MPAFLLGASLLFWGWQTGWWIFALPMVMIYESSYYFTWRLNLTTPDFRKTSNLCTILLVLVLIYLLISERSLELIFSFFQWLPVVCFPLLVAQTYSTSKGIDINALLFLTEKKRHQHQQPILFDLNYPYLALCLLSASAANVRGISFYMGMLLLTGIALWYKRSSRYSALSWILLMVLSASLGIGGHIGLHQLQLILEKNTLQWVSSFYQPDDDPLQTTTAIGDIGSLKRSNQIILRVKPNPGQLQPERLRRKTYNRYQSPIWVAANSQFTSVKPEADQTTWKLNNTLGNSTITISKHRDQSLDLLNLPDGTVQINYLPIVKMEQNQYDTVKTLGNPSWIAYQVNYDEKLTSHSSPTEEDLQIPNSEVKAIAQIIDELNLQDKSSQEILQSVASFFQNDFKYSLELTQPGKNATPLSAFLLENRVGHCEYFATATVLLLRALGIPARYAVGYSVREYSSLEKQYIVRERNAHAWTLVYVDDIWQTFDTTPADWMSFEDAAAPDWQFILDFLSWFLATVSLWLQQIKDRGLLNYWWLLLIPLVAILLRQFYGQETRRIEVSRINQPETKQPFIGNDSEIYAIEQALNKLGFTRHSGETFNNWIERIKDNLPTSDLVKDLQEIARLHYRYRFDPQGINIAERAKLKYSCQLWLDKYQQ